MEERLLANAIRFLSIDSIEKANSGHPGSPLGMADVATVLWRNFLKHNPIDPNWINRDRFILSNGHSSMLLYALLHLTGYDLSIQDLKNFRQLHSKTPGHPEYGCTPGVEVTSGPLGQGIANAVGMALAEKILATEFNRKNYPIIDHYTYVFLGDGCLMEGISHEACSLAGNFKLGKLIAFWDKNNISIDGRIDDWFTDDTASRFHSYGWQVIDDIDGHNFKQINFALNQAKNQKNKPTLLCFKTVIGYGSPNKAGHHDSHGSPLGKEEVALTRKALGWSYAPFEIPKLIYAQWNASEKGKAIQAVWKKLFSEYQKDYPKEATEFLRRILNRFPKNWKKNTQDYVYKLQTQSSPAAIATRQASQKTLNYFAQWLPELFGGSADLSSSNLTRHNQAQDVTPSDVSGNYIHYGVREFGMSAIMNGIALHGGFIPYGGTFLVFMEYARNAVRMAALMKIRTIFVYTHDSIGLGEDGPTHQPIEQLATLRLTPNMETWRSCDQVETAVSWQQAVERLDGPTALIFTRQSLVQQMRSAEQLQQIAKGGYILQDCKNKQPDLIIISSGSEVALAMHVATQLNEEGKHVRVVSMPCVERFEKQDIAWKESVLPFSVRKRFIIEASIEGFWRGYAGLEGKVLGIKDFGKSAPASVLFNYFGFTKENALSIARSLLENKSKNSIK
ncbi:transketolase [Sodalis sp. CWE]|uniref:transketolase n=1 Tax=Sodalis sp. CWE TaxID=2803816 RepID=UPI001C7DDF29|nr:transketolase [Sodalis sp. CWE]